MKKLLLVTIVALLSVSLFAELKTSGEMRTRMTLWTNWNDANDVISVKDHNLSSSEIDSRMRLKFDNSFDENLRAVLYTEVGDIQWGNADKGGAVETDGKIIEVKQAYMEYLCKQFNTKFQVGLIGWKDHRGLVLNTDLAAMTGYYTNGDHVLGVGLAKLTENDVAKDDDSDLIIVDYTYQKMFGAQVFYNRVANTDAAGMIFVDSGMWIMPWFNYKMNNLTLDLMAAYNNNSYTARVDGDEDTTVSGLAAAFNANYKDGYEVALDVLYSQGSDFNSSDKDQTGFRTIVGKYYDNGLEIWGLGTVNDSRNLFPGNSAAGFIAGGKSTGLTSFALRGAYPLTEKLTAKAAVGMVQATETPDGVDAGIGTEIDLGLKYNIYEKLDLNCAFAYGIPGDYYKDVQGANDDLENIMKVAANLGFKW